MHDSPNITKYYTLCRVLIHPMPHSISIDMEFCKASAYRASPNQGKATAGNSKD